MNAFYEHHKNSIEFVYRCFDRILLNGLIQPFQQPERVLGFFNTYRDGKRVIRRTLTEIADHFHHWVINRSERWRAPIVEAPQQERRDDFVLPYSQKTEADHVAVILKAREPARILVAIGGKQNQCPHLELKQKGRPTSDRRRRRSSIGGRFVSALAEFKRRYWSPFRASYFENGNSRN
jgi:hypothetical protein